MTPPTPSLRLLALMVRHLAHGIVFSRARPAIPILGVALAILSAIGTAQAQPTSAWDDFDCQELIGRIQPPDSQADIDVALELAVPPGTDIPQYDDPISVDETLGPDGTPLEIRSRSEISGPERYFPLYLSCMLIVAEFFETENSTIFDVREKGSSFIWQRMPILLVRITSSPLESIRYFADWMNQEYSIPVVFPSFGGEPAIDIRPLNLRQIGFLEGTDWNDETARFIRFGPLPSDVKTFLDDSGAGDAGAMMVLCGQYACHDIANTVRAATPQEPPPPPQPVIENTGTPDCEPEPPDAVGTCRAVTLAFSSAAGWENAADLDTVGDLGCILSAIDPGIFETPPPCEATADGPRAREELAALNPVIRIAEDGRWLIVAGSHRSEPDPDPLRVEVSLPEGQSAHGCQLDLEYTAADGQSVTVPLEPLAASDPARFAALLRTPPRRYGDNVLFRIHVVSSAAECGGPTREVLARVPQAIEVPLISHERVLRAVAHVLPVSRDRLEIDLGFDEAERLDFVRAALGALEAAHAQLAALHADRAWPLILATVSRLDGDGGLVELESLDAATLRRPTREGFAGIESQFETLMENQATLSRQGLADALTPLLEATDRREIDHLTIILVAPPSQRTTEGLTHPCSDPRYRDLAADLARIGGPQVQVVVFPLIGLFNEDAPDLSVLVPLTLDPDAPTLPGGLYACRDTPPGMEIYPFFVEPWRARVSIAPRYATALSDRLAGVLATLLTEGEPIR